MIASLNLLCHSKGFSDEDIEKILRICAEEYLKQIYEFCEQIHDRFSLTLQNTTGKIRALLNETRIKSHVTHLDRLTMIKDYDRKFVRNQFTQDVDPELHHQLMSAFQEYLTSIPENKKYSGGGKIEAELTYHIKDVVQCSSPGIGSAGKISYSFLIEGQSETLDNDIILYMKPAQKSAISYVAKNDRFDHYFKHDGLRTVLCSYAMQASTPRWLGYTTLNSIPCMVDQVTAHSEDLNWSDINNFDDVKEVVRYLGKATGENEMCLIGIHLFDLFLAKIHCVADADCVDTPNDIACLPFSIIPRNIERTIHDAIDGRKKEFIEEMVEFGMVNKQHE